MVSDAFSSTNPDRPLRLNGGRVRVGPAEGHRARPKEAASGRGRVGDRKIEVRNMNRRIDGAWQRERR